MGDYDRSRGRDRDDRGDRSNNGNRDGGGGGGEGRRRPDDVNRMFSIKIDNISYDTTRDSLEDHYGKYGKIGDVYIPKDRESGRPRGFAFVRFLDRDAADKAIGETDGTDLDGRQVRVEMAKPIRSDSGGGRGGGGYGGGGGGYRGGRGGGGGDGYRGRDDRGGGGYRGGGRDGYRRDDRRRSRSRDRNNGGDRDRRDYR